MRKNSLRSAGLVVALLAAASAWANHAESPINLTQQVNGAPLATAGMVSPGEPVRLTATAPASTFGTGTYELELEIRPSGDTFTNTPTHSGGVLTNKTNVDTVWPGLTITTLAAGSYKWQARTKTNGTPSLSAWVPFAAGALAFTVAPPNVPDIVVQAVELTNVSSQPTQLDLTVRAQFKNRGTAATGPFTWNAYLSADTTLDAQDQLIFTSTAAVDVPGEGTLSDDSAPISLTPRPAAGSYYVLVEADPAPQGCTSACGTVTEFDERNNVGRTANYFVNGLDLVATSISNGPTNAGPGTSVTLNVSFFNQGIDSAPNPVEFRIVATRDAAVSSDDYEVYRNTVTVGGGQAFNLPVTFNLPQGIAGGDVQWGLQVDPATATNTNPTVETKEDNNTALSAAKTHVQQADLIALFADLVDTTAGQPVRLGDVGQQARFKVTVQNEGDFAAPSFHIGVVVSRDNTLSLLVDHLFADVEVTGLQPGAANKATYDLTVTLPTVDKLGAPLTTGDYYFFLQADSFNVINEQNEPNNTIAVLGPVRLRSPAADYAVLRVQAPTAAAAGETIALSRTIKNVGTDAGAPASYACFASVNDDIRPTDFQLEFVGTNGTTSPTRIVQLAAGEADASTEWVRLPGALPAGRYYLGCIVDPANAIAELSEENNALAQPDPTNVAAQAFQITTAQLPDAIIDTPYQFGLTTVGADGAISWELVGAGPENISLGATDGTLAGSPTKLGITTLKVRATAGSAVAEALLTLRVLPPTTQLTVTTASLPPLVNSPQKPYQAVLSAAGGAHPYQWSLVAGTLPNGLSLDAATGVISGNPRPGIPNVESKLTVAVREALGSVATRQVVLRTVPPGALTIATLVIPDAMVGNEHVADVSASLTSGASLNKPLKWSVAAGALPDGLTLTTHTDQTTGLISGIPSVAGTFAFTLQVEDAYGRVDTREFVTRIYSRGLKVTLAEPPPSELHPSSTVDLAVTSEGTGTVRYRLFAGALPPGLTLAEDGKITGTLEEGAVGSWNFTVEATDMVGARGLGGFNLEVTPVVQPEGCSSTSGGLSLLALLSLGAMALLRRRRARVSVRA